ncbi:MAG: hypothetical protein LBK60_01985 [Verrucomicrobiales bacterium]|jgi:triacylglycerol lipase|nr:hypothetical protein [Verrucomicrobiales bacterium]
MKNPVVLVHGFKDSGQKMSRMAAWLRARGWATHTPTLAPSWGQIGIDQLARQLDDYIASSLPAAGKFDLIGFSMGGLITRYWLQKLDRQRRVEHYLSIAAPHHGTLTAYCLPLPAARQMRYRSEFLRDLDADADILPNIKTAVLWTPLDLMIIPATSARLPGAREYKIPVPAHQLMVTSEKVFRVVERVLIE